MSLHIDRERVDALMKREKIPDYQTLALKAKLHYNTVTNALSGKAWNSKTAESIAKALKCNPIDIQVAAGYPDPSSVALVSH